MQNWKTRILRQIHTADPVFTGRKSCQYRNIVVLVRLSAHTAWDQLYVFGAISSSSILFPILYETYYSMSWMHRMIPKQVHWRFIDVCFIQVTKCGALDALTRHSARTFFYWFHTFLDHTTNISIKVRAPWRRSAKQCSKLSLGQSKHG